MENIPEDIIRLIVGVKEEDLNPEEKLLLREWICQSPEHLKQAEYLRKLALEYQLVNIYQQIDSGLAWKKVERQIPKRPGWVRKRVRIQRYKIAAVLVPLLFLSVTVYMMRDGEDRMTIREEPVVIERQPKAILKLATGETIELAKPGRKHITDRSGEVVGKDSAHILACQSEQVKEEWRVLRIPAGGEYQLILSDGTRVWLNSDSELKFPVGFPGDRRLVELKGEGYFDVACDSLHPFIVRTINSEIRVLGTSFNVCSYAEDKSEQTTLVSGKVEVTSGQKTYLLSPGKQFEWLKDGGEPVVRTVDTQLYVSWKEGIFRFMDMPLEDLCLKLHRWYGIDFFFLNPSCKEVRFTGMIGKDVNVTEFIKLIETTTHVRFEIKGNTVTIMEK